MTLATFANATSSAMHTDRDIIGLAGYQFRAFATAALRELFEVANKIQQRVVALGDILEP